ncbi:MAG: fused DSP-PTPase phosphatase/NAD kinase-like protein [Planctomycetota bacterium]
MNDSLFYLIVGEPVGIICFMNDIDKAKSAKSKKRREALFIALAVVIGAGYYSFFFVARSNSRAVVAKKVYRSSQPRPEQLKKWVSKYGIKTVLNLRGNAGKVTEEQQKLVDELGIKMISISLSSSKPPTGELLAELIDALETAEQPYLIHCHSGVDRTGTVSAMATMAVGGASYEKAKSRAYIPPGPWKRKRKYNYSHISDIFKAYENYCRRNEVNTGGWEQFKAWAVDIWPRGAEEIKTIPACCYLRQFSRAKGFYPIVKVACEAETAFAGELAILAWLAVAIYRKLVKNIENNRPGG